MLSRSTSKIDGSLGSRTNGRPLLVVRAALLRRTDCALVHRSGTESPSSLSSCTTGARGARLISIAAPRLGVDMRFEANDEGGGRAPVGLVGLFVRRSWRNTPGEVSANGFMKIQRVKTVAVLVLTHLLLGHEQARRLLPSVLALRAEQCGRHVWNGMCLSRFVDGCCLQRAQTRKPAATRREAAKAGRLKG
jgi:hypothetical protein